MEWPPFDLVLAVCRAGLVDDHMKGVGNELEMSKNVLHDTAMESQPIIEACTTCSS